jgi:hypothetical protein
VIVEGIYNDEFIVSKIPLALGRPLTVTPSGINLRSAFEALTNFGSHSAAALIEYSLLSFFKRL